MNVRVLHICESFGGGVFTIVRELCNGQAATGLAVGIAFSLRDEAPVDLQRELDSRVSLYDLNRGRRGGRGGTVAIDPSRDLRFLLGAVKAIFEYRPDVIHAHSSKAGLVGRLGGLLYRATGARISIFYSPHGFAFLREDVSRLNKRAFLLLERMGYMLGGVVVGCSAGEGAVARKRIGNARVAVIENAIDLSEIPIKSSKGTGPITVVTAGRISPQKDPHLFAAVAKRIADDRVTFRWIGGGEPVHEAILTGLPRVEVTGWLPRAAALQELSSGDIYLQTSRWEGMPVAVIEAMAAGLPAVVTDIIGNRDIVQHGETGFIARSEDELVQHISELVASDSLRAQMGARARQVSLQRFGLPRLLDDWQRAYEGQP